MAAPFGFSIGDFISGIDAFLTVIKAVRDVGGSTTQYQAITSELETLKTGLSSILFFDLEPQTSDVFVNLCEAAASCEECIKSFIKKIAKYQPWLKPDTEGWKAVLRKIQWAFCNKKDVLEFRQQVTQRICAIQLHISAVQAKHCSAGRKLQLQCQSTADATLQAVAEITSRTSRSEGLLEALSSQQLDQCEETQELLKENKFLMTEILKRQTELIELVRLQKEIPAQVLLQRPVKLLDACGYETYFHLDFIISLDVFKYAIRARFEDQGVSPNGLQKVDRLEFAVRACNKEVFLKRKWQQVFKPGQTVDMSMKFRRVAIEQACPRCRCAYQDYQSDEVECGRCGLQFRRVIENEHPQPNLPEPHHHETRLTPIHIDDLLEKQVTSIQLISSSHADELDDFSRVDIISSTRESDRSSDPNPQILPVDFEPVDFEPVDFEPADSESVNSEPLGSEPVDSEPGDFEPVDSEHAGMLDVTAPTSYRDVPKQQRLLEPDMQGVLQVAPLPPTVFECPFNHLTCRRTFTKNSEWYAHSLEHFGSAGPPLFNRCCFCDKTFQQSNANQSWRQRMEHVETHHLLGHRLAYARPDFELFRYLWEKKIINDALYRDLFGR